MCFYIFYFKNRYPGISLTDKINVSFTAASANLKLSISFLLRFINHSEETVLPDLTPANGLAAVVSCVAAPRNQILS